MPSMDTRATKNHVSQEQGRIRKIYRYGHNNQQRFLRERTSLQRLDGVPGFPQLLGSNETLAGY